MVGHFSFMSLKMHKYICVSIKEVKSYLVLEGRAMSIGENISGKIVLNIL
jgi:hypothetical protein